MSSTTLPLLKRRTQTAGNFQETTPVDQLRTVEKFNTQEGQRQCITAFDLRYILQSLFGLSPTNPNTPGDDFSLTQITEKLQTLETDLEDNVADLQSQIDGLVEKGIGANTNLVTIQTGGVIETEETERSIRVNTRSKNSKHRSTFNFVVERNHTYLIKNQEEEESVLNFLKGDLDQFLTGDTIFVRNSSLTFDQTGESLVPPDQSDSKNIILVTPAPYRFLSASNILNLALSLRPGSVYMGVFNRSKIVRPNGNNLQLENGNEPEIDLDGVFEQAIEFPTEYLIPAP